MSSPSTQKAITVAAAFSFLAAELYGRGITTMHRLRIFLAFADVEEMTMRQAAVELKFSDPQVHQTLMIIHANGLLNRRADKIDGRVTWYSLSDAGKEILRRSGVIKS